MLHKMLAWQCLGFNITSRCSITTETSIPILIKTMNYILCNWTVSSSLFFIDGRCLCSNTFITTLICFNSNPCKLGNIGWSVCTNNTAGTDSSQLRTVPFKHSTLLHRYFIDVNTEQETYQKIAKAAFTSTMKWYLAKPNQSVKADQVTKPKVA